MLHESADGADRGAGGEDAMGKVGKEETPRPDPIMVDHRRRDTMFGNESPPAVLIRIVYTYVKRR